MKYWISFCAAAYYVDLILCEGDVVDVVMKFYWQVFIL